MKALSNTDYYNFLLEASKEAFETFELKDTFYSDEAMEDIKENYIYSKESLKQLGVELSDDLTVNYQINIGLTTAFFKFLNRQQLKLEKSHLIERNDFYKRCLDSLNIKLTEWYKKEKYRKVKGISDMKSPPDTLEFLEYTKQFIELKALQTEPQPKITKINSNFQVKKNENELPPYDQVFFVHYQCDDFNEGKKITSLGIYENSKVKEYASINEAQNILDYLNKITELQNSNLKLIHWNQDRTYYGTDHINKRYGELTGNVLNIEYSNDINLAEWLIFKYGQDYISHPRLDNLAKLNQFLGIKENEFNVKKFSSDRLMLLSKIYCGALNDTLKTEVTTLITGLPTQKTEPQLNKPIKIKEKKDTRSLPNERNFDKKHKPMASVSAAFSVFNVSKTLQLFFNDNPKLLSQFLKIDTILVSDTGNAFDFPELISLSKDFILTIPSDIKDKIIDEIILHISTYKIIKQTELKHDNSYFVVHKSIKKGTHTQQSHLQKATKEGIDIKLNLLNEYEKWLSELKPKQKKESSVNDFFKQIKESSISKIEIYNQVQKLTDNFVVTKLDILFKSFEEYLFIEKDKKKSEYSEEEITIACDEFLSDNKPLPYYEFPDSPMFNEKNKKPENILDLEKLLFPYDFYACYQFKGFLNEEIRKVLSSQSQINKVNFSDKSSHNVNYKSFDYIFKKSKSVNITDLMNSLKKNFLIDQKTELKFFKKIFSNTEIENKIIWSGNISQLAYFIKYLHNISGKIKDTKQKQWDITIKCFSMSNGTPLDKKKLRRQKKPANPEIIEKSIKLL